MKYFISIAIVTVLFSCSKDKRYENKITDDWTIESSSCTYQGEAPQDFWQNTLDFQGNISFEDNFSGISSELDNCPFPKTFSWTHNEERLTLTDLETNESTEYYIDEFSKTRMYLKESYETHNVSGSYQVRIYITLTRN